MATENAAIPVFLKRSENVITNIAYENKIKGFSMVRAHLTLV